MLFSLNLRQVTGIKLQNDVGIYSALILEAIFLCSSGLVAYWLALQYFL